MSKHASDGNSETKKKKHRKSFFFEISNKKYKNHIYRKWYRVMYFFFFIKYISGNLWVKISNKCEAKSKNAVNNFQKTQSIFFPLNSTSDKIYIDKNDKILLGLFEKCAFWKGIIKILFDFGSMFYSDFVVLPVWTFSVVFTSTK